MMKRILALLMVVALLMGCSAQTPAAQTGSSPTAPAKSSGPKSYPLLRVATPTEPPGIDPMWQLSDITRDLMVNVMEPLFTVDGDYKFKPMLAEKMDISSDGKTFTISLRKGVLFHNGKEMTSEDVVASVKRWMRLIGKAKTLMKDMESITASDKYTVVVRFTEPNGGFFPGISVITSFLSIFPKEIVEKYWDPDPRGKEISDPADVIGTGPYKIAEWVRDRHIRLVKFDKYSASTEPSSGLVGKKTAWADEIRFMVVKDDQTRLNGLITGEYDVAYTLNPALYATVQANPTLQSIIVKPVNAATGVFNKSNGSLFSNPKLRNAAHWAIDYAKVMAGTIDGDEFYRLSHGVAEPEWSDWYNEGGKDNYNHRDLEKAKRLMAEAGYKGEKIRWVTTKDYDYMYRSALVASEQMKEAGFNVELIVTDWSSVISTRNKKDAYEIFSTGIGFPGDPPSSIWLTPTAPGWYDDPENNAIYNALVTTVDPAKRKELFTEQQRIFWEKIPYLRFGDLFGLRAAPKEIKGMWNRTPPYFFNVWLDK